MVAAAIRETRKNKGVTREKLAADTGIPFETVVSLEVPRRPITVEQLRVIAMALDTTIGELCAAVDERIAASSAVYRPDASLNPDAVSSGPLHDPDLAGLNEHVSEQLRKESEQG